MTTANPLTPTQPLGLTAVKDSIVFVFETFPYAEKKNQSVCKFVRFKLKGTAQVSIS